MITLEEKVDILLDEVLHIEGWTAAGANDLFSRAGMEMRVNDGDIVTHENVENLWDAAMKLNKIPLHILKSKSIP